MIELLSWLLVCLVIAVAAGVEQQKEKKEMARMASRRTRPQQATARKGGVREDVDALFYGKD